MQEFEKGYLFLQRITIYIITTLEFNASFLLCRAVSKIGNKKNLYVMQQYRPRAIPFLLVCTQSVLYDNCPGRSSCRDMLFLHPCTNCKRQRIASKIIGIVSRASIFFATPPSHRANKSTRTTLSNCARGRHRHRHRSREMMSKSQRQFACFYSYCVQVYEHVEHGQKGKKAKRYTDTTRVLCVLMCVCVYVCMWAKGFDSRGRGS